MEESDDFEDFLFDSIKRYHTLQMFTLENVPNHLLQLDELSLCVVSQRSSNSELLRLQLPKKLLLPPDEEGRSKDNDFKVMTGVYTESFVHTIKRMNCETKVLTSELNVVGLKMYDLVVGSRTQQEHFNVVPWVNPNFAPLRTTSTVLCSRSTQDPLLLIDIETKKNLREIQHKFDASPSQGDVNKDSIMSEALNCNMIVALNTHTGGLNLFDIRTDNAFIYLSGYEKRHPQEIWSLSGHDDSGKAETNHFGILSNRNSFCIYDIRQVSKMHETQGNDSFIKDTNYLRLKFNSDENKFSSSGLDSNVNVFGFDQKEFNHLFRHNGHSPSPNSSALVTDHIWLPVGNKELVVSVCENKSLNCWEFRGE